MVNIVLTTKDCIKIGRKITKGVVGGYIVIAATQNYFYKKHINRLEREIDSIKKDLKKENK